MTDQAQNTGTAMPYDKTDGSRLPWLDLCFTAFVMIVGISAILLLIHG